MQHKDATVLVTDPIPPIIEGLSDYGCALLWEWPSRADFLKAAGHSIRAIAAGPRAPIDQALIEGLPSLELIAKFGAGYETVDVGTAIARGVTVTHTPDAVTHDVADFAIGLLLALIRRLPQADRYVREGHWQPGSFFPISTSLRQTRVGIVGLGRIGRAIAQRCEGFGWPVSYSGTAPKHDVPYLYYENVAALARDVNVLFIAAAGGESTHHLVNAAALEALGADGVIVNIGRGTIVNQPALVTALAAGKLRGAALDVLDGEPAVPAALLADEKVLLTPHCAGGTLDAVFGMADQVVANVRSWLAGNGPINPVPEMTKKFT